MNARPKKTRIDSSGVVEVIPGKVSGVPILCRSRVQADSIVENYESGSPVEEISYNFDISETMIRQVLTFAAHQRPLIVTPFEPS